MIGGDGKKVAPIPPMSGAVTAAATSVAPASPNKLLPPSPDDDDDDDFPIIIIPHDHDALCGRGGSVNAHPGNKRFRALVEKRKRVYLAANFKREKRLIAASIVKDMRELDPPGRFLARRKDPNDKKTDDNDDGEAWYDIGDDKAREKTSQALRDHRCKIDNKENEDAYFNKQRLLRREEEAARQRAASTAAHARQHRRHRPYNYERRPPPPPAPGGYPYCPPHPRAGLPSPPAGGHPDGRHYYHEHGRYPPLPHPRQPPLPRARAPMGCAARRPPSLRQGPPPPTPLDRPPKGFFHPPPPPPKVSQIVLVDSNAQQGCHAAPTKANILGRRADHARLLRDDGDYVPPHVLGPHLLLLASTLLQAQARPNNGRHCTPPLSAATPPSQVPSMDGSRTATIQASEKLTSDIICTAPPVALYTGPPRP